MRMESDLGFGLDLELRIDVYVKVLCIVSAMFSNLFPPNLFLKSWRLWRWKPWKLEIFTIACRKQFKFRRILLLPRDVKVENCLKSNKAETLKMKVIAYKYITCDGSVTLQQRYYCTATVPLKCNCNILCVLVNLKVVLSLNYCLIFFMTKISFGCSFLICNCF